MSKGIHVSTLVGLVIAVIILILFSPILIKAAGAVWSQILQALGLAPPPTALEQAIKCAYLRCEAGCLDSRVTDEIKWQENGREVSCNEFCWMGIEHVCGDDSFKYPVNVTISSDEEISKDRLEVFNCISTRGLTPSDWRVAGCGYRLLGYGEQDVKSYGEKETCLKYLLVIGVRDGYKTVTLKKGTYYITISDFPYELVGCFYNVRKITEIWSKSDFMATRYRNQQECENAGYKWCSVCDENERIRSILKAECILPDEDCGEYDDTQNCLCHETPETCTADEECQWEGSVNSCKQLQAGQTKCEGIFYPKCSGGRINKWGQDYCDTTGKESPDYQCSPACGAECGYPGGGCPSGYFCAGCSCVAPPRGGCLEEGSLIATPNGFKRIEELKEGDYVLGYKDGQIVTTKIIEKSEHTGEFILYFYKGYWFTGNHLVYTDDYQNFKPVSELSTITKQYNGSIYNIQTEIHNYFGENGLLIHNK